MPSPPVTQQHRLTPSWSDLSPEVAPGVAAEPWRLCLARGDEVEVKSATAGKWLPGAVTGVSPNRIQVEYAVDGERCEKVMLRSSADVRLRQGPQEQAQQTATPVTGQRRWVLQAAPPAATTQEAQAASPEPPGVASAPTETVPVPAAAGPPAAAPPAVLLAARRGERPLAFAADEWLRLADLQLGELLGSGGFGSVHRGMLRGEQVAIKRMHLEGGAVSPMQLGEFQKEVANLQALRHPRLIRFIGVALEPPLLCIVTELAPGGSLFALLHVHRAALSDPKRRLMVLQIIEGVAFLHGRRPPHVHRDLKSANVVLDAELNAKLCDFGLAESMEKTHISRREAEGGSPRYMAPELFDARGRLTEKLDVWALGCLVIETLTVRMPHEDCQTLQQVAVKLLVHNRGPFEDGWAAAAGLRADVPRLLAPCFARGADGRPAAAELLEGLSQLDPWRTAAAE